MEDVLTDPTYQNKVIKALKLGYTEQLLQQAVLKLGRKAGEDQILEELIRLQKTVAKNEESNNLVTGKQMFKQMISRKKNIVIW